MINIIVEVSIPLVAISIILYIKWKQKNTLNATNNTVEFLTYKKQEIHIHNHYDKT